MLAINKNTSEYVYAKIDEYVCPECNEELILCKGNIRIPYFRHKVEATCNYTNHVSESQIHKDAKILLIRLKI